MCAADAQKEKPQSRQNGGKYVRAVEKRCI